MNGSPQIDIKARENRINFVRMGMTVCPFFQSYSFEGLLVYRYLSSLNSLSYGLSR